MVLNRGVSIDSAGGVVTLGNVGSSSKVLGGEQVLVSKFEFLLELYMQ